MVPITIVLLALALLQQPDRAAAEADATGGVLLQQLPRSAAAAALPASPGGAATPSPPPPLDTARCAEVKTSCAAGAQLRAEAPPRSVFWWAQLVVPTGATVSWAEAAFVAGLFAFFVLRGQQPPLKGSQRHDAVRSDKVAHGWNPHHQRKPAAAAARALKPSPQRAAGQAAARALRPPPDPPAPAAPRDASRFEAPPDGSKGNCRVPMDSGGGGVAEVAASMMPWAESASMAAATAAHADALAAAVRSGRAKELPELIEEAIVAVLGSDALEPDSGPMTERISARLLISSLRACAASRRFKEALATYDYVAQRMGGGSANIWSLLLYSAVEAEEFDRCKVFFNKLCEAALPSSNDFLNMARYHAHRHDRHGLRFTLDYLAERGCKVDLVTRNRALSACCGTGAIALAEDILACRTVCPQAPDVVAFNTLMKGCVRIGASHRCFDLYEEMRKAGVTPSEITFGILLETCHTTGEFERAKRTFADLTQSGMQMNVVHYTAYMKCLVSAGHVGAAGDMLERMRHSRAGKPDLVAYSMIIKAHADRGNIVEALDAFDQMVRQGIRPDSVVLNIILGGCCARPVPPEQVVQVLRKLTAHGLRPSAAMSSIVIKALAMTEAFEEALALLESRSALVSDAEMASVVNAVPLTPEPRVFAQLAQACARAGRGQLTVDVYAGMMKAAVNCRRHGHGFLVNEANSARMVQICASVGQAEPAKMIHRAVIEAQRGDPGALQRLVRVASSAATAAAAPA
mmetsp:Transcript_7593/g.21576  ORF Transcript_7593/g.21576 Transcript_7593/m.21576 type:complete len:748 (+) Transcript_7593:144-2387(+)